MRHGGSRVRIASCPVFAGVRAEIFERFRTAFFQRKRHLSGRRQSADRSPVAEDHNLAGILEHLKTASINFLQESSHPHETLDVACLSSDHGALLHRFGCEEVFEPCLGRKRRVARVHAHKIVSLGYQSVSAIASAALHSHRAVRHALLSSARWLFAHHQPPFRPRIAAQEDRRRWSGPLSQAV